MSSRMFRDAGSRSRRNLGGNTLAARTLEETTAEWNRRSGERISAVRVQQILAAAERKLTSALAEQDARATIKRPRVAR